ncbi:EcsC family protein [Lentibacillus amyloliquefaciens]|uniref:ABC transporter-associated protein EcsC n=1 Tax=Lentibacillus amyloliquefaciens TaxID=1472767 RepID=A0A0U4G970_9BACI|nr:EcsC family protein [Lentibacillus amyloliquefaciens]ALX49306.1 ABC transporter-associated protein EcsC [Lentibacillus amyloliquefaciens]
MNGYEQKVYKELKSWRRHVLKKSGLISQLSKQTQTKLNGMIPEKAHKVITESIKNMVKATLFGSNITTNKQQSAGLSLFEKDQLLKEKLTSYRKTAVIEGAGTGAGGFFLGIADFPMLLSIKMKFLFEAAAVYGYDTSQYEERLFILYVFQLAFSSDNKRKETFYILENWETEKENLTDMDWRTFQQEYRDYIDLIKLLQLVPGFGAIVGAYANHNLLDTLGETAMNVYRMRLLTTQPWDY